MHNDPKKYFNTKATLKKKPLKVTELIQSTNHKKKKSLFQKSISQKDQLVIAKMAQKWEVSSQELPDGLINCRQIKPSN